jgi:competence protein ComEA
MQSRTLLLLLPFFLVVLAAPCAGARADDGPSPSPETELVDINEASVEELTRLPGIGPAKARAIVEYRARRRFLSPAAIQRVKGIGRSTYLRLRHMITVGNR